MTATSWARWVLLALALPALLAAALALVGGSRHEIVILMVSAVLLLTDTWRAGVATAVLGLLAASRTGPRSAGRPDPAASARAAAGWAPQRVREVVGDPGDRVRAVRAVRRADPRLDLADAVRLVDAAADDQQRGG